MSTPEQGLRSYIQPLDSPLTPQLEFSVISVEILPFQVVPTLVFTLNATESNGLEVFAVALSTQIQVDPARRTYDPETRVKLAELFGEPERWGATTHSFQWTRIEHLIQSFTGARAFTVNVPCTYDLEVAATKYFYGLADGRVPLTFHFSGTVIYRNESGTMQICQIDWSTKAQFHMPVEVWKQAIAEQYPKGGWVRLSEDTLGRLHARRGVRGLASFDACVVELLDDVG